MDVLGFDPATDAPTRRRVLVVLGFAVLGISSSAVIVRAMEMPALTLAAWRTLGAGLLLSPALRSGLPRLTARDAVGIVLAGVALGLHFWGWFASLDHTTVLRSTVLVCLTPVWTALLEWSVLGERPRRALWLGLAIALPGVALMSATSSDDAARPWTGDALAVGAGVLWSVYMLLGRRIRQRVDVATYMGLVCLASSALLFPAAWATDTPVLGWSWQTWGLLLLAIAGPQLVGHQGFSYAIRYVAASTVSALTLLEPVGATLLAAVLLAELPGPWAVAGSALVLGGIFVATYRSPSMSRGDSGGDQPSPPAST